MDNVAALPAPVPDAEEESSEKAIRELLAMQAQEFIQLAVESIRAKPVRGLCVIESYSAAMRAVLADLGEAPAPRRQRRGGYNPFEAEFGQGIPAVTPGAMNDVLGDNGFLGRLEGMVNRQTSSQTEGATARQIRDLSAALESLPEDSPLRQPLHEQITGLVESLAPATPPRKAALVIETGALPELHPEDLDRAEDDYATPVGGS